MAQYGNPAYWDKRYESDQDFFDWYQRWAGFKEVVKDVMKSKSERILVVGCGRSKLSADLYKEGYHNQLNIDVSDVAIQAMRKAYDGKLSLTFQTMDVTDMRELQSSSFNIVMDKGCFDCLACAEDNNTLTAAGLSEISRLLKPGGRYICVSYGQPSFRTPFFDRPQYGWSIEIRQVNKPNMPTKEVQSAAPSEKNVHYIYICTKNLPSDEDGTASLDAGFGGPAATNSGSPVEEYAAQHAPDRSDINNHSDAPTFGESESLKRPYNKQWERKNINPEPDYALDG